MEQKEIEIGNKLIVLFLNSETVQVEGTRLSGSLFNYFKKPSELTDYEWSKIKVQFDRSWDWIMPAVRKAKASKNSSDWDGWNFLNQELLTCNHPKFLFPYLIEFIKWYNTDSNSKS